MVIKRDIEEIVTINEALEDGAKSKKEISENKKIPLSRIYRSLRMGYVDLPRESPEPKLGKEEVSIDKMIKKKRSLGYMAKKLGTSRQGVLNYLKSNGRHSKWKTRREDSLSRWSLRKKLKKDKIGELTSLLFNHVISESRKGGMKKLF